MTDVASSAAAIQHDGTMNSSISSISHLASDTGIMDADAKFDGSSSSAADSGALVSGNFKQIIGNKYRSHAQNKRASTAVPLRDSFSMNASTVTTVTTTATAAVNRVNASNSGGSSKMTRKLFPVNSRRTSTTLEQDLFPLTTSSDVHQIHAHLLPSTHLKVDVEAKETTTEKYFGENARLDFFERYHWLSHQQAITNSSNEQKLDELLFDNEVYGNAEETGSSVQAGKGSGVRRPPPLMSPLKSPYKFSADGNAAAGPTTNSTACPTPDGAGSVSSTKSRSNASLPYQSPSRKSGQTGNNNNRRPSTQQPRTSRSVQELVSPKHGEIPAITKGSKKVVISPTAGRLASSSAASPSAAKQSDTKMKRRAQGNEATSFSSTDKPHSLVLPTVFGQRRQSTESIITTPRTKKAPGAAGMSAGVALDRLNISENEIDIGTNPTSFAMTPRSKYISACLNENINPRASLIVRKTMSKQIHLQHQGIGDQMAKLFAESVEGLPFLESINIADNRLTDIGMEPMLRTIANIPTLTELDLSQNVIGPKAAEQLSLYLTSANCSLQRLILQQADVDDSECKKFVETLRNNHSLTEIDLSSNKIGESISAKRAGSKDHLNGNGVDAIADLLANKECRIRSLTLTWNMIRLGGAVHLAESLYTNCSLVTLNLSFNSLGRDGGIALGVAIQSNRTLQTLYVNNNNIDGEACFTICAGILENEGLRRVTLDGNPIGELGSRALMFVPLLAGNRVKVSAAKCNIHIKDTSGKFDYLKLARDYVLDMTDGFERAIAVMLMHLLAGHPTYDFKSVSYESGKGKPEAIRLTQVLAPKPANCYDENQLKAIESLKKLQMASQNTALAVQLFHEVDEDGSGLIDPQELRTLMQLIGVDDIDDKRLADIIDTYDSSGDNQLDMAGFTALIRAQYAETTQRLRELTSMFVMMNVGPNGAEIPASGPVQAYVPPTTGRLRITVVDTFCYKQHYRIMTSCDKQYLFEVASGAGDEKGDMISFGIDNAIKFRLDEGLAMFNGLKMATDNNAKILRRLLPAATNSIAAIQLIKHITSANRSEMVRLKHEMSYSLKPIISAPNGYYELDMTKEMDRLCLSRLITISTTHGELRNRMASRVTDGQFPRMGDLSQKGNNTCFRNEMFNGESVSIDGAFATPMPLSGKLEFDFVTTFETTYASMSLAGAHSNGEHEPVSEIHGMSDKKFMKILIKSYLLPISHLRLGLQRLKRLEQKSRRSNRCTGYVMTRCSKERATKISEALLEFYTQLSNRSKIIEDNSSIASSSTTGIGAGTTSAKAHTTTGPGSAIARRDSVASVSTAGATTGAESAFSPNGRRSSTVDGAAGFVSRAASVATTPVTASAAPSRHESQSRPAADASLLSPSSSNSSSGGHSNGNNSFAISSHSADAAAFLDSDDLLALPVEPRDENASFTAVVPDVDNDLLDEDDAMMSGDEEEEAYNDDYTFSPEEIDSLKEYLAKHALVHEEHHLHNAVNEHAKEGAGHHTQSAQGHHGHNQPPRTANSRNEHPKARKQSTIYQKNSLQVPDDFLTNFRDLFTSSHITRAAKAKKFAEVCEEIFGWTWLYARQLAVLLDMAFGSLGEISRSKHFGSYRVEVVVALYDRVVDRHNFELVLRVLNPHEVGCCYARIGWLNLYNPMKPDGSYQLDLGRFEERMVTKMLCALAVVEPGNNWLDKGFKWLRDSEPVPGWELVQTWMVDEGLPKRGILDVTYYSGDGKKLQGCGPVIDFRKSLLSLVRIDEQAVDDELNDPTAKSDGPLTGELHRRANPTIWTTFLCPSKASKKKA